MSVPDFPPRYEPLQRLGQGGGGEVWSVRDRAGQTFALKVLAEGASERELSALVREAAALSGLEGLGVPRVVAFGRLPNTGRAYLVRELVEGSSLDAVVQAGADARLALGALATAADQLTLLHRAGLLHGDVKPANIIVTSAGVGTLVDLGLAAPFREGGCAAEGLSPRYAAPELFEGKPLTVRAEVYALGVTLEEIVEAFGPVGFSGTAHAELTEIAARATARQPAERYPSVDEVAVAVRRAAALPAPSEEEANASYWPVTGIDGISATLLEAASVLAPASTLRLQGAPGSGRTALLRRLSWSLGAAGRAVSLFDAHVGLDEISREIAAHGEAAQPYLLVDDADAVSREARELLLSSRRAGARLIVVGGVDWAEASLEIAVPPLDLHAARDLLRRAIPSLSDGVAARVLELAAGRPGELSRMVRQLAGEVVTLVSEVDRVLGESAAPAVLSDDPLTRATSLLDRGRYGDGRRAVEELGEIPGLDPVAVGVLRARLSLGLGEAQAALSRLLPLEAETPPEHPLRHEVLLYLGRAQLGAGNYASVLELLEPLCAQETALGAEALAFHALGLSLVGRAEEASRELERAVQRARLLGNARAEAVTLASQGLELQRADRIDESLAVYQLAIGAAERADDAGTLAVVRANLAGLLKIRGDVAGAIEQFEAALHMGRRSGRANSARQALLNLANLDLYLGRVARARARIDAVAEPPEPLPAMSQAQLLGLTAELALQEGRLVEAVALYEESAAGYEALGRGVDSAEARLEGVLAAARLPRPELAPLRERVELARRSLGDTPAHRPLLLLASASVAQIAGDEVVARGRLDDALRAARESGQREWCWRTLEARAELEELGGQPTLARRDRDEAVALLEEIGARLPRDLREVYWNDPRRAALRQATVTAHGVAAPEYVPLGSSARLESRATGTLGRATTSLSQLSATPLERRLSRLLEVNAQLVGESDLERLTARVTDYAVELARAERGLVLLRAEDGTLSIHTSRARGANAPDPEFSRSIAETVIESRQPLLTLNAQGDSRMAGFSSVHQMLLEAVACVPILAPDGAAIGALYVETRQRKGAHFEQELPTLRAFADQVAIALQNARLLQENRERADQLEQANASLLEAQSSLRELLGDRTEQLKRARRRLKDARETLYGHFGYHGLVGTSAAMRRVYALIERVSTTDVPALITGESGTGKEMVARAIHETSPRAKAKMLGVNCGAIPENLLESELFGHVRGAFTGADRDRRGLFRECNGGTILLDEIGETPPKMQAGLLRVLQEKRVRPVGGSQEEAVDVRVIFATNRDLRAMVEAGKFREDLYYRIQVVEVHLPPLRERLDDIPQLVDHFLGIFAARYKREKRLVSREALRSLAQHPWPGNVRQLENVLLNAWVMSEEDELLPEDFDLRMASLPSGGPARVSPRPVDAPAAAPSTASTKASKGTTSEHFRGERERILDALRSCNWNRVKAAELSGIPRRTFYRRLREYGIQ